MEKKNNWRWLIVLMGYKVNIEDKDTLTKNLFSSPKSLHVISGNPEVLYTSLKNDTLRNDFLREDSIIIPDGIGVVLSLKWRGYNAQKIAGIELADNLLLECERLGKSVFLLGATEEANSKARLRVETEYPTLNIKGSIDGFYYNEKKVVEQIKQEKPDVLLVAMGCPRQEEFIIKYRDELNVPIMMGVGGTFDVWADMVKRAPRWMINCHMEWLYRLIKQPQRIGRYQKIISFMITSKRMAKKEKM